MNNDHMPPSLQNLRLIIPAMAMGVIIFAAIVIFLITGNWLAIAAPAIGLLLIARNFPTRDKLNRFSGNVTGQHRL